MSFPRVTILCPELGTNALGRSLLLARLLPTEARPEIVGFRCLPEVWKPARTAGVPIHDHSLRHVRELPRARRWLRARIDTDLLLICKPLPTSLGLALLSDLRAPKLALDIDDWEVGLSLPHDGSAPHPARRAASAVYGLLRRGQPNSTVGTWLCESQVRRVPHRLVSNAWLARRFGGTLLYHVRDARALDPERVAAAPMREKLTLDDRPWVGFVGTVRPHKGLRDLVTALALVRGPSAPGLLLLGTDPDDPVVRDLVGFAMDVLGPRRLRVRRMFPLEKLSEHLAVVDVIAVPSREMEHSRGQLPAKIFDAMAMAKPVIATAVNEVSDILEGCGIVVPPGDPAALAEAIEDLRDPAARGQLGAAGRKRLVEHYSVERGRRVLREFVLRAVA